MTTFPHPDSIQRLPDEQEIFSFHKAFLYGWKLHALFLFLLGVVFYINTAVIDAEGLAPGWLRLLSILPLLAFLEIVRRHFNEEVVVKSHVIEFHQGKVSLSYAVPVIDYADIREVRIDQSLLGRILNFGDVSISTAATEGVEMVLHGVPSPTEFKDILEKLRMLREKNMSAAQRNQD